MELIPESLLAELRSRGLYRKTLTRNGRSFSLFGEAFFLEEQFPTWEPATYEVLDQRLVPHKGYVDIGTWFGPLAMYAADHVSHVVCIEADPVALLGLRAGIAANGFTNVHVIPKALYNASGWIAMQRNTFRDDSYLGDSTSQVNPSSFNADGPLAPPSSESPSPLNGAVASVSVADLAASGVFDNVALVKVDIEGGEQLVLLDLLRLCKARGIGLLVSFHLPWWDTRPGAMSFDDFLVAAGEFFPQSHVDTLRAVVDRPFESALFF